MECSETYKNWVKYLKIKGLYCEYLYTMGKVVDHNFFIIFSSKRPKPDKTFIVNSADITCFPKIKEIIKIKEITKSDLMKIMKQVDSRVMSINNVYMYQEHVRMVFINNISWATVVKEFFIYELRQKYGDEALERMYKRMEIRKEKLRKAEEEKRKKLYEDMWGSDSRTIEPRGEWYFTLPDPPLAETARPMPETHVVRRRNREERGQWYDRINTNNIRRQDRWRFRR
jgi:hypothetical protein